MWSPAVVNYYKELQTNNFKTYEETELSIVTSPLSGIVSSFTARGTCVGGLSELVTWPALAVLKGKVICRVSACVTVATEDC